MPSREQHFSSCPPERGFCGARVPSRKPVRTAVVRFGPAVARARKELLRASVARVRYTVRLCPPGARPGVDSRLHAGLNEGRSSTVPPDGRRRSHRSSLGTPRQPRRTVPGRRADPSRPEQILEKKRAEPLEVRRRDGSRSRVESILSAHSFEGTDRPESGDRAAAPEKRWDHSRRGGVPLTRLVGTALWIRPLCSGRRRSASWGFRPDGNGSRLTKTES